MSRVFPFSASEISTTDGTFGTEVLLRIALNVCASLEILHFQRHFRQMVTLTSLLETGHYLLGGREALSLGEGH